MLVHLLRQLSEGHSSFASVLNLSGFVACAGFLVHSFVDFNPHLPRNALLFFLMAILATSRMNLAKAASGEAPRHRNYKRKR